MYGTKSMLDKTLLALDGVIFAGDFGHPKNVSLQEWSLYLSMQI